MATKTEKKIYETIDNLKSQIEDIKTRCNDCEVEIKNQKVDICNHENVLFTNGFEDSANIKKGLSFEIIGVETKIGICSNCGEQIIKTTVYKAGKRGKEIKEIIETQKPM